MVCARGGRAAKCLCAKFKMKRCVSCGLKIAGDGWRCSACGYEPVVVENFLSFSPESVETGVAEFNDAVYTRMAALEVRSFYFQARRALILWVLRNYFPGMKNYYDLGTGTGWLFAAVMETWPKLEMVGSDLAFDSLRWTSKRLTRPAMLMHCDVNRIPYADEFDVVGAYDVIEHIDDDVQALRSIRNAVKPGGGMILTVPQHMVLWSHLDEIAGHRRRYVGTELADKARQAGFSVALDTSFMASLFLPQYAARRFLAQKQSTEFETEHTLSGPLNGILKGALLAELGAIQAGMRFPFGGMRVVVGMRDKA